MHVLYGAPSGNSLRAAIALSEAGVAFDPRRIDLAGGEHRTPAFARLNPHRRVPVLVTAGAEGRVITQSNAIMFFASEEGTTPLLPASAAPRWYALERYFYFVTDVIASGHAAFHLRQASDASLEPAALRLAERARVAAAEAEVFLEGLPFLAGPGLTLADISAFTFLGSILGQLDPGAFPRVFEWHARLSARPGFRRGLDAFNAP